MYFLKPTTHAVSFVISSKILPIQMLFFESVSNFMYRIYQTTLLQQLSVMASLSPNQFIHITLGPLLLTNFTLNIHD